ncbi:MAG: glycosyl hydrolase [Cyclobacteriaceae bacterium]
MRYLIILLLLSSSTLWAQRRKQATPVQPAVDLNEHYAPVKWRNIGPFRGGRSVASSGVIGDPMTYYMTTTGGGVWKTYDAGNRWENISDGFFKTGSVGAIAVSESDPNVVYVGMGEHAPRGVMTSYGDGVYKSTDAGKTWQHLGLELTRHIANIKIHPNNPDIVYVAAQGAVHGPTEERGIYKSTDGGETWRKVLYVDQNSGASSLSMDMTNPRILYAAMWDHRRLPWQVVSGGPGSGIYKSVDSGETWFKIQEGLPKELGKIGISVSRDNPDKVYAIVESDTQKDQGGLFASSNGGKTWSRVSRDHRLTMRAWYYTEVFADPTDENTVYVLSPHALKSIDGGKSWSRMTGTHGDFHDLWINPDNGKNLVISNDGGAGISFNQGDTWSRQDNMPTAQFYRVNVDNVFPYRIYGGQQDNSSVMIPHRNPNGSDIDKHHWTRSAGGESAFLAYDPDNPRYVMGGSYQGAINVLDTRLGEGNRVMSAPIQYLAMEARDMKYRFNWNAPIIWSKHESNVYYHGAQVLLKTKDRGISWEEVSPDLTRNEDSKQGLGGFPYTNEGAGGENYGTLSYVVESPHEKGVIWTGSDDGYVQITRDGGDNWTNVTPAGLKECLINAIEVSPHDPATAYIATTRYKFNDFTPAMYKTTDYGQTWTNISNGLPYGSYGRVVREDEERKDLLFTGTEMGVYVSFNGGQNWTALQLNLPIVPITDLIVRHGDLVAATQGRSFWVLDDLGLIRQYAGATNEFKLYQPEDAYRVSGGSELNSSSPDVDGMSAYTGVNPASGVVIYYNLDADSLALELEIKDGDGNLVRKLSSTKDPSFVSYPGGPSADPLLSNSVGLNRIVWDMRYPTIAGVPTVYIEGRYGGHKAAPGEYSVTLKAGDQSSSSSFTIMANPLIEATAADYQLQHETMSSIEQRVTDIHTKVNSLSKVRDQVEAIVERLTDDPRYQELISQGKELLKKLTNWDEELVQRKSEAYDDTINFENKLTASYLFVNGQLNSNVPFVTKGSQEQFQLLEGQWKTLEAQYQEMLNKDIPSFNESLNDAGVGVISSDFEESIP